MDYKKVELVKCSHCETWRELEWLKKVTIVKYRPTKGRNGAVVGYYCSDKNCAEYAQLDAS